MGIDGGQKLQIRGPKAIIDEIQESGATIHGNEEINIIANRFFGKNASVVYRTDKCIVFNYDFRNEPIHQYLKELLITYPQCWIKNEHFTDCGYCGMWIGRFRGDVPEIQEFFWTELCDEEAYHCEDFSKC